MTPKRLPSVAAAADRLTPQKAGPIRPGNPARTNLCCGLARQAGATAPDNLPLSLARRVRANVGQDVAHVAGAAGRVDLSA